MNSYPVMPGVPAAGHIARNGAWHPNRAEGCVKCDSRPRSDRHDYEPGEVTHRMHTDPDCRICGGRKH